MCEQQDGLCWPMNSALTRLDVWPPGRYATSGLVTPGKIENLSVGRGDGRPSNINRCDHVPK